MGALYFSARKGRTFPLPLRIALHLEKPYNFLSLQLQRQRTPGGHGLRRLGRQRRRGRRRDSGHEGIAWCEVGGHGDGRTSGKAGELGGKGSAVLP